MYDEAARFRSSIDDAIRVTGRYSVQTGARRFPEREHSSGRMSSGRITQDSRARLTGSGSPEEVGVDLIGPGQVQNPG